MGKPRGLYVNTSRFHSRRQANRRILTRDPRATATFLSCLPVKCKSEKSASTFRNVELKTSEDWIGNQRGLGMNVTVVVGVDVGLFLVNKLIGITRRCSHKT